MQIVPRRLPSRMAALVVLLSALVTLAGGVDAQGRRFGPGSVRIPEPTEAGSWEGTYWYLNRDMQVAMWIRTVEGLPEVRLQVLGLRGSEEFVTDWNGEATYEARNARGEFALHITERDANRMKGTWNWDLVVGKTTRRQRGEVTLYRAGIGREIVLLFDPYEFYIGPVGEEAWQPVTQAWTFRKASKRLVRWDELPF